MVDFEVLREREIEALVDPARADPARELGMHRNKDAREVRRVIVRTGDGLGDADGERRQVVEEERVEVIAVEHGDRVGLHFAQVTRDLGEQTRGFAAGAVAQHLRRKRRRVRNAERSDDLRH